MKAALIAAIMLALFVYFAPRSYGQQDPGDTQQGTDKKLPASNDQVHSQTEKPTADKESPRWYKTPEWILVVVGGITALVIGYQSYYTRKAAEIFIQKERARIEIMVENPILRTEGNSGVLVRLKNNGPTIGFIESASARLTEGSQEIQPDYLNCVNLGFTGTIGTGETTANQTLILLAPSSLLTQERLLNIRQKKSFVHSYGIVRYRDVYDRIYERRLHLRFSMTFGGVMPGQITEWWDIAGPREDNEDREITKNWFNRFQECLDKWSDKFPQTS